MSSSSSDDALLRHLDFEAGGQRVVLTPRGAAAGVNDAVLALDLRRVIVISSERQRRESDFPAARLGDRVAGYASGAPRDPKRFRG